MSSDQIEEMDVTRDVRLVVEYTIKNCASGGDFESMGGVETLVKRMLSEDNIIGLVEDDYKIIHIGIISDSDSGESCPGCFASITLDNVGGYRTFCSKCIEAFPEFPTDGRGYFIGGTYPNFKWVQA